MWETALRGSWDALQDAGLTGLRAAPRVRKFRPRNTVVGRKRRFRIKNTLHQTVSTAVVRATPAFPMLRRSTSATGAPEIRKDQACVFARLRPRAAKAAQLPEVAEAREVFSLKSQNYFGLSGGLLTSFPVSEVKGHWPKWPLPLLTPVIRKEACVEGERPQFLQPRPCDAREVVLSLSPTARRPPGDQSPAPGSVLGSCSW